MSHPPPAAGPGSSGGPRLGTVQPAGARTSSGAGPADLLAEVTELRARVAELERVQMCGDADRPLTLAETAKRIGPGKSVSTIRGWIKRPESRRKYRLEMLLRKDPSGRYFSSPRLLASWMRLMTHQVHVRARLIGGQRSGAL